MEDDGAETQSDEHPKNMLLQTENPAFEAAAMVVCGKCARANPPTRPGCLYCGAQLEFTAAQSRFMRASLRPLEAWGKGFNLIFVAASGNINQAQIELAAAMLGLETEVLRQITESGKSLPLARVETLSEAEIVQKNLRETAGVETTIVGDEILNQGKSPRRLRSLEFTDDKLIAVFFNDDGMTEIDWSNLVLIVTGAIFERRVEATEARGKGGEIKLLDSNETASDEILFDFYSRDDAVGYRVPQKGFDFSCLGAEKSLLVAENLRALVKQLSKNAPDAKIVEDYLQIRAFLAAVWAVEERTDARGLKRQRFGAFNRENVTIINNAAQFEKYSRLQRHLV